MRIATDTTNRRGKDKDSIYTPRRDRTGEIFGLTNAPNDFWRLMNKVFVPLRNKVFICYINYLLIGARDWLEMISKMELVLEISVKE